MEKECACYGYQPRPHVRIGLELYGEDALAWERLLENVEKEIRKEIPRAAFARLVIRAALKRMDYIDHSEIP